MINVTKTYLPDSEKYKSYIDKIFESGWLTNNGQFTKKLQAELADYLGLNNILLVSNGTIALQLAYKLAGIAGDVLTTPFSFVATTSTLVWEGLNPVFVDINPKTYNLDPKNIEKSITPKTSAIVATHVFGNPCDIEEIEFYSNKYNLKVIYDAAHAFGVKYNGESILNFGDISTISFHSTKLFHTIEGGAIVFKDKALFEKAKNMINFGIKSPTEISGLGINAKLNEFQSAMGLCVLEDVDRIMEDRKKKYEVYYQSFYSNKQVSLQFRNSRGTLNYSHFPILLKSEDVLNNIIKELNALEIYPRRYFYPSLDTLNYLSSVNYMEISNDIAKRILCLPLYDSLPDEIQEKIIKVILQLTEEN
ncbi:DegT/DnrJ/EryC1/StrS family aminotransferase [Paenibacillus ehimensis]|uniref:DegT/DnrJ/EryC1/StrS family aminotransferase n=1 Tax=Paenibacillus ehimensis TaxID=79264 RepID=UPI003D2BE426